MFVGLDDNQISAVYRLATGKILCARVGAGKSRTALAYYMYGFNHVPFQETEGGIIFDPPDKYRKLYVITTAKKRDELDWEKEGQAFLIHDMVVDSWNNIWKYKGIKSAFFIFDEQHLTGNGVWAKTFKTIARHNDWILLTATPGDKWEDYMSVFIANGFYTGKRDMEDKHFIFDPYVSYRKVKTVVNEAQLMKHKKEILVEMEDDKATKQWHIDLTCDYCKDVYKAYLKTRWNYEEDIPVANASKLVYILRKICNSDGSRLERLWEICQSHPKLIIFYQFDYERDLITTMLNFKGVPYSEYNGHIHQDIPTGSRWAYVVHLSSSEGWNCIETDTVVFYSLSYSYRAYVQACGRTDRRTTPFQDLYYYRLKSDSPIDKAIMDAHKRKKKFNESNWVRKLGLTRYDPQNGS